MRIEKITHTIKKNSREWALFGMLIGIILLMSIVSPDKFFTFNTLRTMAFQLPELGIMTIAMMVVLLTGSANLSTISVASISGIATALVMTKLNSAGTPLFLVLGAGLGAGLVVALLCGLVNGFFVAYVGVAAWLTTLATSTLFDGLSMFITKGRAISGFPEVYYKFSTSTFFGIPSILLLFVAVVICATIILEYTPWGRTVFMVGCSPMATEYSGINTKHVYLKVYLFSATASFLATIVITARYNSAKVDYGSSYLMQSIAACVLGGVDIHGGSGKVGGVVLAVTIMQVISSGLNTIGVNRFFIDITTGVILIAVLAMDFVGATIKNKKMLRGK